MSPSTTAACFTGHTTPSAPECALLLVAFPTSRIPLFLDVEARVSLNVFEALFDFRDFFRFLIKFGGFLTERVTAELCGCVVVVDGTRVRRVEVGTFVSETEGSLGGGGEITGR